VSSLLLISDDGERRLPEQDPHYLWLDAGELRVSTNPPDRAACVGYFVSELGTWWFHTGPSDCPRELRINGRSVTQPDTTLASGRAEVRLSAEPYSDNDSRPAGMSFTAPLSGRESFEAGEAGAIRQLVIGPAGTGADIVIDDPSVRPDHARVEVDARGDWWIIASSGDVSIDGEPVTSARREPGSRFTVGRRVITVPSPRRSRRALSVELEAVHVRAGGRRLLDNVSLTVPAGDFVVVVSPDDAGGQLLLGLVAGGYRPDSGRVRIAGSSRRSDPRLRRVPATDDLYGTITVHEALTFAAARHAPAGQEEAGTAALISETMSWMGLDHRESAWIRTLSDAERRRLSIGLELVARPGLLVIMQAGATYEVGRDRDLMSRLRTVGRDTHSTIMVATRSLDNLDLADTVVVLDREGRLRFTGPPGRPLDNQPGTTRAEWIAGLEEPTGDTERGRALPPAHLPAWEPVIEPEGAFAGIGTMLRQEALLVRRRGNGSSALLLLPMLGTAVVALFAEDPIPLAGVAVAAGLIVNRFDLVTERAELARAYQDGVPPGALVAAKLGVQGGLCAALAVVMGGIVGLSGIALPAVPGLSGWLSAGVLLTMTMVPSAATAMLGCASARSAGQGMVITAALAVVLVMLTATMLSTGWVVPLAGLAVLGAGAARGAVALLQRRLGG